MTRGRSGKAAAVLLFLSLGGTSFAQVATDLTDLSLDDLLASEVVYSASRRIQSLREAPSAVSVVTAAEIRAHGYRTLADVLRSLSSFYVTDDRHYANVGVRGFNRPGDYGARVLLLLDGLRTNDNLFEQAYVGQEFLLDLDLVERIEVVRGPSAAVHGNSAFFAVVNVVTRQGRDFQGGELSASASSFGTGEGRATYGRRLDSGLEYLVSASLSDRAGQRLYYPEYDAPDTANGIAERLDGERVERARVSLSKGELSFEATHVSRDKGIPTGAFGALFGDPRTRTTDGKDLLSLTWERAGTGRSSTRARVHYGSSDYHGLYPRESPVGDVVDDSGRGQWYAVEAGTVRPFGARHLVTAGVEFQDSFQQRLRSFNVEPRIGYQDSHNQSRRLALFAQDEITLSERVRLHAGVREDWSENFGYRTSPRLGLVYDDGRATTLKLLGGHAFRAPNEYELHGGAPVVRNNPALGLESILTAEAVVERRLPRGLRLNGSVYVNEVHDLIVLDLDPDGLLVYRNADRAVSVGAEAGLELKHRRGASGHLRYAWQQSRARPSNELLTNSPRHMAKAAVAWPLLRGRLTAGVDGWYLSSRRTLSGARTGSSTVANLTLVAPDIAGRFDVSASVYNVLDGRYSDPGAPEHRQDVILQDGRNVRLKLSWRF